MAKAMSSATGNKHRQLTQNEGDPIRQAHHEQGAREAQLLVCQERPGGERHKDCGGDI